MLRYKVSGDRILLLEIWIAPDKVGNGKGSQLLDELANFAKKLGVETIEVFTPLREVIPFYEKNGYILKDNKLIKEIR